MYLSKKFKKKFSFFKFLGATLENVCLPTEKLKPFLRHCVIFF